MLDRIFTIVDYKRRIPMAIEPKYDYEPDFVVLQSLIVFGGSEYGSRGGLVFYTNDFSEFYTEEDIIDLLKVAGTDENKSRWYDIDESFDVDAELPRLNDLRDLTLEEVLALLPTGELDAYSDYN